MKLSLRNISEIVQGELYGDANVIISQLSTDSRNLVVKPNLIFCALVGEVHNGHKFIDELLLAGVNHFIVSDKRCISEKANFILVNNTLDALQELALSIRKNFSGKVIAITGSNGKTITKEWLANSLNRTKNVLRSPRSYNSQVGVPLSVLPLNDQYHLGVFEAGISEPNEMMKLARILKPNIGVFTNIGDAHQENFTSLEQKINEKLKLFDGAEVLVYSSRYSEIFECYKSFKWVKKPLLYEISEEKAAADLKYKLDEVNGSLRVKFNNESSELSIPLQYTNKAFVDNSLSVIAVLNILGYSLEEIKDATANFSSLSMRLEIIKGISDNTIINDAYNNDINALRIGIDMLLRQTQHKNKIVIISDFEQSGIEDAVLYKELAEMVKAQHIHVLGVGPKLVLHQHLFESSNRFFLNTTQLINYVKISNIKNSAILVKGARRFGFEEVSSFFQYKEHQTVLEINLNNLVHNLNAYKKLLLPETKVMVLVKALSYGSGSYEIASTLQHHRVDYLGVAFANEGLELRKANIHLPILVLNPSSADFDILTNFNLEPEIYSQDILIKLISYLDSKGLKDFPIHIKIDSGMHRLGFQLDEVEQILSLLQSKSIRVKSIFTHLAAADNPAEDEFTIKQLEGFKEKANTIINVLGYKPLLHALNTAGIERFSKFQFDMVRLGIGIYGASPYNLPEVKPVSQFKSHISKIQQLTKGDTVGYNRNGRIIRNSFIATVPIGYADGINRKLGNGNYSFIVNGKKAPTVGNICMDMCMLDVTNCNAKEGDEVLIFGYTRSISNLAKAMETIPYEILTSISPRVKKIYIHE
jgi:alanine racemase